MNQDKFPFQAWLDQNMERFTQEHYTDEEIGQLAISCGYSRIEVANWESKRKWQRIA